MSSQVSKSIKEACSLLADQSKTGYTADMLVNVQDILKAAQKVDEAGYFIEDVSCLDMKEGFMVVYHFAHFEKKGRVCLRAIVDRDKPDVPSVSSIYPGADWHERECYDFFGINFVKHPNLIPLLLDPEHDGPPPLIKEEGKRKDIYQLYPGLTGSTVSPDSKEFAEAIN
ncbi:NADH-quinone oxidoreductase subunit C [Desulfonatronovibrio magnus]|uniref:NADH-quinone oxidoreductase subunit C n=1 Tax=Desulfonatronovibrio magnus TaxID=698827 RepID=UPI0005EAE211|nr:NADH-quinone oxidoreductase subunit C [Desulfonatronovibrio magnus]